MVGQQIQTLFQYLPAWLAPTPATELSDDLAAVPPGILNNLRDKVHQLSPPQPHQQTIQSACADAIKAWQAHPETVSNTLVVLSRPVEAIAPILKASLPADHPDYEVRLFLAGYQRPDDALTIASHLRRELEPEKTPDLTTPTPPVTEADMQRHTPTVMVIPNLEQYFLRCIQGWEGIEYLQTLSTRDPSRFWVFGCNHWAWAFLERVCQISAYLEQVVALPELSGDDLKTWLEPLWSDATATLPQRDRTLHIDTSDAHWHTLASIACGISTTAAQAWIQSLRCRAEDLTEEGTIADATTEIVLLHAKPTLPSLMTLAALDRFVLHSLLIHGEMTRYQLALSLGEAEHRIRSRVQILQREGIIEQRGRRLRVHAAYYPKIYSELGNNNFLIGNA